jgi:hypothetical protein
LQPWYSHKQLTKLGTTSSLSQPPALHSNACCNNFLSITCSPPLCNADPASTSSCRHSFNYVMYCCSSRLLTKQNDPTAVQAASTVSLVVPVVIICWQGGCQRLVTQVDAQLAPAQHSAAQHRHGAANHKLRSPCAVALRPDIPALNCGPKLAPTVGLLLVL